MRVLSRIVRHGSAAAVLAALTLAAPALGAGNLNTFIDKMTPAQNAAFNVGAPPPFQVFSRCKGMNLEAFVSRSSTVDGEGQFLSSDIQDQFPMQEVPFGSGAFDGTPQGTWLQQPGQYYWQVRSDAQCEGDVKTLWVSQPVFIQIIGQGSSGGGTTDVTEQENGELLTIAQARTAISPAVKKAKKRTARGLRRTCTRAGSGSILAVLCTASWSDNKTYRYNGSWRMALNDDGSIAATFNGRRALISCVKKRTAQRRSVKPCYKKHKFTTTVS